MKPLNKWTSLSIAQKKGLGEVTYNGEVLTGENIYRLVAEGTYFAEEEAFVTRLREITSVPMVGPLLWHYFYSYNEAAFILMTKLLKIVHTIEQTEAFKAFIEPTITKSNPAVSTAYQPPATPQPRNTSLRRP